MRNRRAALVVLAVASLCRSSALAADAATTCKTTKMTAAGAYNLCVLRTTARAVRAGVTPDFSKCDANLNARWAKAESKGGAACPTSGDAGAIRAQVHDDVAAIVAALTPGAPTTSTSTTTSSSTTTSVSVTTSTSGIPCGNFPGCGGTCPSGQTCWATVGPSGPSSGCFCRPSTPTPCGSSGGSFSNLQFCGGECPVGEVCTTIDVEESLTFHCGCIPAGATPCIDFAFGTPCGGTCPTGMSCGAGQLLGCRCQ